MVGRSLALLASKLEESFAQSPLGLTGMPIAYGEYMKLSARLSKIEYLN